MPSTNLHRLVRKNLLYIIHHIVDTPIFKHIYVRDVHTSREFDALDDGSGACAYTVSGVLALVGLIDRPHATVATTITRMQEAGWVKTDTPEAGDVVQWDAHNDHMHMAFYIGNGRCIGNATSEQLPKEYDLTLFDGRKPAAFYTHPQLHQDK